MRKKTIIVLASPAFSLVGAPCHPTICYAAEAVYCRGLKEAPSRWSACDRNRGPLPRRLTLPAARNFYAVGYYLRYGGFSRRTLLGVSANRGSPSSRYTSCVRTGSRR